MTLNDGYDNFWYKNKDSSTVNGAWCVTRVWNASDACVSVTSWCIIVTFWQQVVRCPDCQDYFQGRREQSPWAEVKQFRCSESSLRNDVQDTAESSSCTVPDDDWVSDFWRHRSLDDVSIHISGKSACILAVPVAAQQVSECMDDVTAETELTYML